MDLQDNKKNIFTQNIYPNEMFKNPDFCENSITQINNMKKQKK